MTEPTAPRPGHTGRPSPPGPSGKDRASARAPRPPRPPRPTLTPSFAEFLPRWLAEQRWYTGKGRTPRLRRVGGLRWEDPAGEVGIDVHLVRDESDPDHPVTYQVPLTYRDAPLPEAAEALVAQTVHSELGERWVYDAPHDPVYVQALLRALGTAGAVDDTGTADLDAAVGEPVDTAAGPVHVERSHVLRGEQSNTSIIVNAPEPGAATDPASATALPPRERPVIVKVFRVLHEGRNPDVEVQTALAAAGSTHVPTPIGALLGSWDGVTGHLVFAQEYLPGVQDAWREAVTAAREGRDFTEAARTLGATTAEIHVDLRGAFPVRPAAEASDAEGDPLAALLEDVRRAYATACRDVPTLTRHHAGVEALLAAAEAADDRPAAQRIHGDYHLGQVLDVPGRGWAVLDFEGEPLRPIEERVAPAPALRDVAGMLRSFDYAAGSVALGHDPQDTRAAAAWAQACREAFLDGYRDAAGDDPRAHGPLLTLLELGKAVYEVSYEARNRPDWLPIPEAAVARLLGTDADADGASDPDTRDLRQLGDHAEPMPLDVPAAEAILRGRSHDPHGVLGAHPWAGGVTVRVLRPLAESVTVLLPDSRAVPMAHEFHGIWVAVLPVDTVPDYRVQVGYGDGVLHTQDDPYRFLPTLGPIDQHLIGEGRHEELWTALGAHVRTYDGPLGPVTGTSFAVWAPRARGVRVVGDFNGWDARAHPMRLLGSSGVWELFVPGVGAGTRYKYEILGVDGHQRTKADPMARQAEHQPATASVVAASAYDWGDAEWLATRAATDPHLRPMSTYEVHLGSWRQGLGYRELADQLVDYVRELGFTHVELLPVMHHPYPPSWGYHVTGYYAPDARFGTPDELRHLIDRLHQAGIGVILDWVPGHFATDPWALERFDGEALYEHPDRRRGWHPEWGSYIFDFGNPQVRNFLVANALYWLEEFHVDGLRVDGVASMLYLDYSRGEGQWLPNRYGGRENLDAVELLQEVNATAYRRAPGAVMIAEESTSWPGVTRPTDQGGLGFGLKWNMGWMHDSLDYVAREPVHRQWHHHQLTFSLVYAYSERFVLPISHDEVVHLKGSLLTKMPGDRWQQLANVRAYLAFMWSHPGKKLLFMGGEFAQEHEWADGASLDWWALEDPRHRGVLDLTRDLNRLYAARPALWARDHDPDGFWWSQADDAAHNTYAYLRSTGRWTAPEPGAATPDQLLAVVNFAGTPHHDYRVGVPHGGRWREVLNTDAQAYGGSGVGNLGGVEALEERTGDHPFTLVLSVPPLGALWLEPEPVTESETQPEPQVEAPASAVAGAAPPRTNRPDAPGTQGTSDTQDTAVPAPDQEEPR